MMVLVVNGMDSAARLRVRIGFHIDYTQTLLDKWGVYLSLWHRSRAQRGNSGPAKTRPFCLKHEMQKASMRSCLTLGSRDGIRLEI